MGPHTSVRARPRGRALASVLVAFALLVAAPSAAFAHPPEQAKRQATVATYNLYLGADLTPLFTAAPGLPLVQAAAAVHAQMIATDFPARAERIAREIAEQSPSLVGLQEVALWQTAPLSDPTQLTTTFDFLEILLDALEAEGVPYAPVATNVNFGGALPISGTTLASFTDRDVILARTDLPVSQLKLSNPFSANFQAALPLTIGGMPIQVPRGWSSIDVKLRGKSFRFVNTHLEAFSPLIRMLQAQELVGWMATSPLPVVLAGDLNTLRGDLADAYGIFLGAGFVDAWVEAMGDDPGFTAGQRADLLNFPSELDHTVDYIMHNRDGNLRAKKGSGEILGEEDQDRTDSGLWPSDHAGVSVTLRIAKP